MSSNSSVRAVVRLKTSRFSSNVAIVASLAPITTDAPLPTERLVIDCPRPPPIVTTPPADEEDTPDYAIPTRTLRFGMSGLDVQYTQQRLYTLGYYKGERDGQFGNGVLNAVKAFQKKHNLTVDGVLGAASIKLLFSTGALAADEENTNPETHRTLRLGMEGEDVAAVQLRLKELGYYTKTADGVYGTGTVAAVKAFQAIDGEGYARVDAADRS